ncbi:MAG TPA: NHLP bacteriocin export ABC transporter permease/ATPase subunit [Lachnospiraceae bacterium]|nr:NHLP bacteriocin export ABC transporter permease/ATPase subunit [Lachnospiraceae bacterium]
MGSGLSEKMENIKLHGGQFYITDTKGMLYRVVKGHVLVYLVPVKTDIGDGTDTDRAGSFGKRMLLKEMTEGERIPAFCHESQLLGIWRFMFMALDQAELETVGTPSDEEAILSFAQSIGLKLAYAQDFEEELIERYNLASVREEGYIYATKEEEKHTLKKSAALIYNVFRRNRRSVRDYVPTGNPLYDAAFLICRAEHIELASYERIRQAAGRTFTLSDISRISHFPTRAVILSGDWFKKDSGVLLAFTKDENHPVPCIPRGPGRYERYDTKTGERRKLDEAFAKTLKPQGYTFYRPFPARVIGKKELFLFGMSRVYPSDIFRLFFLALLGTGVGLLLPLLNEQVYDRYIPIGDMGGLFAVGSVILSCSLGNIAFTVVKNLASFRSMNTMEYAVQNAAIDRLFNLPESFFRRYDAASLSKNVMGLSQIYQMTADSLIQTGLTLLFSFLYLFRMFRYSKEMSKSALILLFTLTLILLWLGIRQTKLEKEKLKVDLKAGTFIFQFVSGIEKIRLSASENRAIYKYLEQFTRSQEINTRKERATILVNVVSEVSSVAFSLIFYYMMVRKSLGLSIGQFTGFTAAFGAFSAAVLGLPQRFIMANLLKPVYENARPILETLPETTEEASLPGDLTGELEVSHVTFSYSTSEPPVLSDLSLHIRPGEYVAVVGPSGCGKSTLLKLLMGFEKPQTGKIYYDNRDIDDMDKRELRKKFGVVLQGGGLIDGSIYDNITITAPDTKIERVMEVIEEVGLKEDIDGMPMGIHTMVTEGAGTISGGQAQRILIARALVGKPKLVFFDEATSALDNVTQNRVVETLEGINATKLVIAHRLSTVKRCDRIIVMEQGHIIEEGDYQALMEQKGFFYELASRQM